MSHSLFLLQQSGGPGSFIISFLPIFLIFGLFYFLIVMPQKKRQRELAEKVSNLKAGDRIITSGGIIATVTAVRDTSLIVRSADKSILEIARSSVADLQPEE
jgi:preprotein translocase subunit YajC